MAEPPKPVPRTIRKIVLVSAIIGYAALIIYLIFFVGLFDLFTILGKINGAVYALAITAVMLSIFFHTVVWYKLLQYLSIKLSFRKTFSLYWVGIFVDSIIPGGWSGDLFKAYLLAREPYVEGGKAVASVVAKNMYEAIFNLGNMILGLVLLLLNYSFESAILFSIGLVMVLLTLPLFVLLVISFRPEGAKKVVAAFIGGVGWLSRNRWNLKKFEAEVDKLLDDYHLGMKTLLEKPKMLTQPMFYSFIAWGLEVATLFLVFASLGFIVMPDEVIIVRSIAGNIESQGYAFAGYAQIVATSLYTTLGIQQAVAASAALLGGVIVFWLKTGLSYVAFYFVVLANYAKNIPVKVPETEKPPEQQLEVVEVLSKEMPQKEKTNDKC
ncbi:MAG: lysylphosphatidylglycerol synthase transmembrane domain-containing protein [Candidatus Bathyarchaeia archaeon]